jgi:Uma2 family endonuclease
MAINVAAPLLRMIWPDEITELDLEPLQGLWTEAQYLKLTDQSNHLIEFTDGVIEVLPMPTRNHQLMLLLLYGLFQGFVRPAGGIVLVAPLRVRIRPGGYREPDVLLLLDVSDPRNQNAFWLGADLVVEIVSPDKPTRDTEDKRRDYAEAGIPEYWIVNPIDETITVLVLDGDTYATHGVFHRGETATSLLLDGFAVEVSAVFDAQ